jgi:hypothetical protein
VAEYREIADGWAQADQRTRLEAAWYVCNDALAIALVPTTVAAAAVYVSAGTFWPIWLPIGGGILFVVSVISVGYLPERLAAAGVVDERRPDASPGASAPSEQAASRPNGGRQSTAGDGSGPDDRV